MRIKLGKIEENKEKEAMKERDDKKGVELLEVYPNKVEVYPKKLDFDELLLRFV